nr:GntR family transcriptional regulator [Sporomusa acidovorans]
MMKTRQAYEFIRSRIIDGTYGPGDKIVMDRVAAELNFSIIPVREAIRRLEADGLVQIIPYSGAIVQMLNASDHEDTHWVQSFLDGGATFLAAGKMTWQDIDELERINQDMQNALDDFDFEKFGELNSQFHEKIYEKSNNTYLIERLEQVRQRMAQIRKAIFTFVPRRAKESVQEHKELIRLFRESAPPEKIEEFARLHSLRMLKAIKQSKTTK